LNYNLYQAEDFAADESFIAYYLKTDQAALDFWEVWISLHPEKLDEVLNAERILALLNLRLPEDELHQEISRFEDFLGPAEPQKVLVGGKSKRRNSIAIFALATCVIAFFFALLYVYDNPYSESPTYMTRHNGYGKITILTLSDGTRVTLNANSTIKFPAVFSSKKRAVLLTGEAFFEVTKDKLRPFTVIANGTKTTVLGTKFDVSAYRSNPYVKVALVEGSVELSVNADRDKMLLRPLEMATFSARDQTLIRTTFNPYEVTSWKNGLIIFNNATFKDIADKLKNSYNIELIDQSGKHNWSFSGQFEKTDYISIIKNICFAEHLNYKQNNQTITIKPKK